jgi:hypothetical protein
MTVAVVVLSVLLAVALGLLWHLANWPPKPPF